MRFIRYAILAIVAIFLILLALANRDAVTLRLMPDDVAALIGYPEGGNVVSLPLFVVIFGGILLGVALGYLAEWLREHKFRVEARRGRRETARLEKELAAMKTEKVEGDEVLALLEDAGSAR